MLSRKRRRFDKISMRTGRIFSKTGLTPNQFTLLTILSAIISFYLLITENFLIAGLFILITGFLDAVDGAVARFTKKSSRFGAYLDTIVDRYVEFIIILSFLFIELPYLIFPAAIWIFLYLFGSMMTTYSKASAREKNIIKKELRTGMIERGERFLILAVGVLLAFFSGIFLLYVIIILAFLTNITALQRIITALRKAR
jgi:archaetidylinositol phosphate synthase